LELVQRVVSMETLQEIQAAVRDVFVHETIRGYIVDVVRATRESNQFIMGSSPRGSLHLMRAAQANAALAGFDFVRPDEVKAMAGAVLAHRVIARAELRAKGQTTNDVVAGLLDRVPAPVPVA